jgi:N-acetylmuramoyl-L-alanine amidase
VDRSLHWIVLIALSLVQVAAVRLAPTSVYAEGQTRITIDAGHGGREFGATYRFADGTVLEEKTLNLQLALTLRDLLEQAGFSATLTRATDTPVNVAQRDLNGDGRVGLADELQARADTANAAGSDMFVSICFNGSSDPSAKGTETFWNPQRSFGAANQQLAQHVQKGVVAQLSAAGSATEDRGAHTDASLLGGDAFFLLGPRSSSVVRPSRMPGIIVEPLFLTNPADANAVRHSSILGAIARGVLQGLEATLGSLHTARSEATTSPPTSLAVAPARGPLWTVWAETYADSSSGRRLAGRAVQAATSHGLPAGLLTTSEVRSLIPGYVVVTSGAFETRQAALAHAARLRQLGYPRAYVRTVPH